MRRISTALAATIGMVLLPGCLEVQSVLAPQGPHAAQIAKLAWLLFALGAAILLAVIVALWLAMRGSAVMRSRLATESTVIAGGIAFPAIVLSALLGYGVWLTRASIPELDERDLARIEVVGEQWWWRVAYAGRDGRRIAAANEIRIPAGREVAFTLKSADVIHSFWIPSLGGKVDMIPGRITNLRLRADRPGIFRGQCAEYCGGAHALMAIAVIAMPAHEFETWLGAAAAPAVEPTDEAGRRGQSLFLAAGCGACHSVRGTPANGTLGPDLTHVGARRSIGADMLLTTRANLARFVVDSQHLKPGNKMPPFRIFPERELDELAAYLLSLR